MTAIRTLANIYDLYYPKLFKTAAVEIKKALYKRTGISINPDTIYYHRFTSALNDPASVTGWRHDNAIPIESRTLTECVLHNFSADAQDNMDIVDQMGGFYRQPANATRSFGGENQIPVKPSVVADIIMKMDFYSLYVGRLNKYWRSDLQDYINITQMLISVSRLAGEKAKYSDILLQCFGIVPRMNVLVKKYLFDIDGYKSTDIIIFEIGLDPHYVLYLPGDMEAIAFFQTAQEVRKWFIKSCADEAKRKIFARHFSLKDRQDGIFYQGVDKWLELFGGSSGSAGYAEKVWSERDEISGDFLDLLYDRQKEAAFGDADVLIKSTAEVRKAMAIRYLAVVNEFFPNPITLLLAFGLEIDQLLTGDNRDERMSAVYGIVNDGLNIALMSLGSLIERRISISPEYVTDQPRGNVAVSRLLREEMRRYRSEGQRRTLRGSSEPGSGLALLPEPGMASGALSGKTGTHPKFAMRISTALDARGIKPSTKRIGELSDADEFGIRHDLQGGQYIVINNKIFEVNSIDRAGYYTLGKDDELGILFNRKIKKYLMIDLEKWRPVVSSTCRYPRSAGRLSFRYCVILSKRVKRILDRHIENNPYSGDGEQGIAFDKDKNMYVNREKNQEYIYYGKRYFPIKRTPNKYTIFSSVAGRENIKLTRVFVSHRRDRVFLVTWMEQVSDIFASYRRQQRSVRMKALQPLSSLEWRALHDYQFINREEINHAMVSLANENHHSLTIDSATLLQIKHMRAALSKLAPARCTVYKMGRMRTADFSKVGINDIFVTDSFVLAGTSGLIESEPVIASESGYYYVRFAMQVKKRAYPINATARTIADSAVLIKDKSYFKTLHIQGRYITLKEIDATELLKPGDNPAFLRQLDFTIPNMDMAGLKAEGEGMRLLVSQERPLAMMSEDDVNKNIDLLTSLAKMQVSSQAVEDYTEAGSDLINNWLRFGVREPQTDIASLEYEVRSLLEDYEKLHDFEQYAYRSVTTPAGVYGRNILIGDTVMDKGFMSASALPINSIEWKNSWTKNISPAGDQVIMVFDKNVPKKVAGSGFLVDHILLKPRTRLKVVSIMPAVDTRGAPVRIVCVNRDRGRRPVKDIFSGAVLS